LTRLEQNSGGGLFQIFIRQVFRNQDGQLRDQVTQLKSGTKLKINVIYFKYFIFVHFD